MKCDRHACRRHRLTGRKDVVDMAVDAAVRDDAHQMRGAAIGLHRLDEGIDRGVREKAAVLDGQVDLAKVHRHDPARADIGVADLGIAHLPGRQPDIAPVGHKLGMGAVPHDPVEIRRIGQRDGIALGLFPQAPAVEDAENYGFRMGHGFLRSGARVLKRCRGADNRVRHLKPGDRARLRGSRRRGRAVRRPSRGPAYGARP